MEIMEQAVPNLSSNCSQCHQKQQLILKYENLITLLKKKADRSHLSHLSQSRKLSSDDITTSHASFNTASSFNRYLLPLALSKLQQKLKFFALFHIKATSLIQKFQKSESFLNKLQKVCIFNQKQCFNKLKLLSKDSRVQNILGPDSLRENNQNIQQDTNANHTVIKEREKSEKEVNSPRNALSQLQNSITTDQWNHKSLACMHEDLVTSINKSGPHTLKQETLPLAFTKKQFSSSQQIRNLYKNLFILEQQNYAYQVKIKNLQRHMEEALSRQIKENRKKTESLEMVAEEMAEKNELIAELQEKITMLEEKYECETNGILEDQLTQHRKQVQKLQKVNIKLDNQLRKTRERLSQSQSSLNQIQKVNSELIIENRNLKSQLFELEQKILASSTQQTNFQKSCRKIEQILSKLKFQQKSFSKSFRKSSNEEPFSSNQDNPSLEELYRLQLVFIFLYNIDDQSYSFNEHQHLFDEEQLEVLKQLKSKLIDMKQKLQRKVDLGQTIQCADFGIKQANRRGFQRSLNDHNDQNDLENIYCHQNMVDGSIFDVLDDHRIEPEKNLTMKLLQMEIEKNKQIEKISELKEKNMYVRNIILNLMKSLELKQSLLKNQTSGILDLIFDVFEYSEEQKQIMFAQTQQSKERRFFGFI